MNDEQFDLVDEQGRVIGFASRAACHGDPTLLHQVVHCLVCNAGGDLLLQLRGRTKDVQPGKWDTSVGGHVVRGETVLEALQRELAEEIGLDASTAAPRFLYRYQHRSEIESELVWTFACASEGPFRPQPEEIEEVRFWTRREIEASLGCGALTPNFEDEYLRFSMIAARPAASPG